VNIYLIGFMGSGKSTAGKKIAVALGWRFIDLDRHIEKEEKLSIKEMFDSHGEGYFRRAEEKALLKVSEETKTVVACGGGTPCSGKNMEVMHKTGIILYLRMSTQALVSRLLNTGETRPLLAGVSKNDLPLKLEELLSERTPWYEQADIISEGINADIEEITKQLAANIRAAGSFL